MSASTKPPTLRVLHLSDLHERVAVDPPAKDGEPAKADPRKLKIRLGRARRYRVLGPALEERLREIVKEGPPDLLVFTGDLADWGLHEEYLEAEKRLNDVRVLLGLGWDRVFLVPGNHDVQRAVERDTWEAMRAFAAVHGNQPRLNDWLAGLPAPQGAPVNGLDSAAKRQSGYRALLQRIKRPELLPGSADGHPLLGYRQTLTLPNLPPVNIIGLDTAWLAGDDHDKGKLLLTEHQVLLNATDHDGAPLSGLRLALMHHPLSDLGDHDARRLLADHVDIVLHGHQHRPVSQEDKDPDRALRTLAAGSLYEGDEEDKWVNSFHVLDIEMNAEGRPLRYVVQFYAWSVEGGHWHEHSALYKNAPGGRLIWETPLGLAQPRPVIAAPMPVAALDKFVGRVEQLAALAAALTPESGPAQAAVVCNLQGMAGVGKSLLVERFFQLHGARFPGGHLKLTLGSAERPTVDALLQSIAERLGLKPAPGDLAARVQMALEHQRPLLHVDNLDTEEQADAASELVELLPHIPLILTGRYAFDAEAGGWRVVPVAPFDVDQALKQLTLELGEARAKGEPEADKRRLVITLAGLPLAISLAGSYLRAGPPIRTFLERHRERLLSMEAKRAPNTLYTDQTRQELRSLAATFDLSIEALRALLGDEATEGMPALCALGVAPLVGAGIGWLAAIMGVEEAKAEDWLSAALTLSIVQHEPETRRWRVHKLLGEHLRSLTDAEAATTRMDWWVLRGLLKAPDETRGARWGALQAEHDAVAEWVAGLDGERAVLGGWVGYPYARVSGPYVTWLGAIARGLNTTTDATMRSFLLWRQGNLAMQAGDWDLAIQAAQSQGAHGAAQVWDREVALAAALRADVLHARGQIDEALRIRRKEVLPEFERLGDLREKAIAMGKIADVLQARGQLDEALRIRREEQLPVYERLGDVREKAVTMGQIADVLQARGQIDEAMRIRLEEMLPAFQRLGDVRETAVTMGQIADVLQVRGQLDEALRIRREEELPAFERLGDVREKAVTMGQIANVLQTKGQLDEALHIRREQVLPAFEHLGDVRGKAATMGQIADVLLMQGQLDEALRIRREEVLPVYERLGDVHGKAVTLGKIADALLAIGELDEALRIRREEVLPPFEALGVRRELLVNQTNLAITLLLIRRPEHRPEALTLLTTALESAVELNFPVDVEHIRGVFRHFDLPPPH